MYFPPVTSLPVVNEDWGKALRWFRYRRGHGGLTENSAFSEILQIDLNSFLIGTRI
ncbi:hypothetical protein ACS5NO_02935 [Larkinella sp. GY13]|uniref:hypothetical protein n=1 Tax=Larkinella sp. GY13 TaxID=3453720 RepID=UPI003EEEC444